MSLPRQNHFLINVHITETVPLFSDGHCILNWSIATCISETVSQNLNQTSQTNMKHKPKWKPELADQFVNSMNQNKINHILAQMNTYPQSQQTIEDITGELQSIFNQAYTSTYPENNKKIYK